jgi:hypothetical protein
VTLTELIAVVRSFGQAHQQINSVNFGYNPDKDSKEAPVYPLLDCGVVSAVVEESRDVIEISFFICDQCETGNEEETMSDMLSIAKDTASYFVKTLFTEYLSADSTVQLTPSESTKEDNVYGWTFSLRLEFEGGLGICDIPMDNIIYPTIDNPVPIGPSIEWGSVTGNIADQTDLIELIAASAPVVGPNRIAVGDPVTGVATGYAGLTWNNTLKDLIIVGASGYQLSIGDSNGFSLTAPQGLTFFSPSGKFNHSAISHNFYAGNVGIGTSFNYAPTNKLEVVGNTLLTPNPISTFYAFKMDQNGARIDTVANIGSANTYAWQVTGDSAVKGGFQYFINTGGQFAYANQRSGSGYFGNPLGNGAFEIGSLNGVGMTIGTIDNFPIAFGTNNIVRFTIAAGSSTLYGTGGTFLELQTGQGVRLGYNGNYYHYIGGGNHQFVSNGVTSFVIDHLGAYVTGGFNVTGNLLVGTLAGAGNRITVSDSTGTQSATINVDGEQWLNAITDAAAIAILQNAANWTGITLNGGTGIAGTYKGQMHRSATEIFFCYNDNQWVKK